MRTVGAPGFVAFGGYLQQRESNPELAGSQKWVKFGNLLTNVHVISAGARYVLNLLSTPTWRWDAADDSAEAEEIAEKVEQAFDDARGISTPWRRIVRRAGLYRLMGHSFHEWTAKRMEEGWIGFSDLRARPCPTISRWDIDDATGDLLGVWQRNPRTGLEVYLPRWKLFYVVDDTLTDSPDGVGTLRHCVEPAHYLGAFEKLEAKVFDTDLRGIPFFRAPLAELDALVRMGPPNGLTEAQAQAILAPLQTFMDGHVRGADTAVLLDSATYRDNENRPSAEKRYDLELLKGEAQGGLQERLAQAIQRKTLEVGRILGIEGILMGADGKGSLALSKDKTQSLRTVVDGMLADIGEAVRKDLVGQLARLNGWPMHLLPRPKIDQLRLSDLESVVNALTGLAQAGAPLDLRDDAINAVRDMAGLPQQSEEAIEAAEQDAQLQRTVALAGLKPDDEADSEDEDEPEPEEVD